MTSPAQRRLSTGENRTTADTPLIVQRARAVDPTGAPIVRSFTMHLPGDRRALFLSRAWTRRMVTVLGWRGDVLRAVECVVRIVDNGVRHGIPSSVPSCEVQLTLTIATDETGSLVIDVADLNPTFVDFDAAVRGEKGRGLRHVAVFGARVTRFLPHEGSGKTVRAVLPAGPVDV
ncbi:ATP-binding protein [Streptomyces sp. NPDC000351]|uniref:ATP-binding protein n=1 Tax=Streptomyces sp. NPDC000351 TaxID=3154250 RepID=UPI00332BBABA